MIKLKQLFSHRFTQTRPPLRGTSGQVTADRFKYSNYSGTEGQRHRGTKAQRDKAK